MLSISSSSSSIAACTSVAVKPEVALSYDIALASCASVGSLM